jgi:hypothetical protein
MQQTRLAPRLQHRPVFRDQAPEVTFRVLENEEEYFKFWISIEAEFTDVGIYWVSDDFGGSVL